MNAKQTEAAEAAAMLKETMERAVSPQIFCRMHTNGASGRSYEIITFRLRDGELLPLYLAYNLAKATGRRFNRSSETIFIGGHGFSAEQEFADDLTRICGIQIKGERL